MRKRLLFIASSTWVAAPLGAQELPGASEDPSITVLGTGMRDTIDTTGQPLSVIAGDQIENVQGGDIARVLELAPGLSLSRNGGPGAFTGVSLRGASAEQLLVLVDGVRLADPASPAGGFDFGTLLPAGIGKIEILRGSNGTIWGSQAIGGVLAAWSDTTPGLRASAEYGARDTAYGTVVAAVARGPLQLAANGAGYRTDGFSAAAGGSEPDGFRQWQAGANGSLALGSRIAVRGLLRYVSGRVDLDGYPAPAFVLADTAEYQDTHQFSALGGLSYRGGALRIDAAWSGADTRRDNFDSILAATPAFSSKGRSDRLDLRGSWQLSQTTIWFGGENEWTRFASSSDARQHARTSGAYAQIGHRFGRLSLNAGARIAEHSRFGAATTFGADGSWELGGGWRVLASFGEGFKAPTLFQLFSDYGNASLRPERSTSADLGIEVNGNAGRHLSANLFRRDSEGLIDFVSCFGVTGGICAGRPFGTYANVGRARTQGLELEARQPLGRSVALRATYSLVDARARTLRSANEGNRLARRPRQTLSLAGEWQANRAGATLGADLRWVSASFDDAANLVRLSPYTVLDLTARWPLTRRLELYGRVENLWNERYQTAAGYASPPRGAFLGARVRW
jgi:vitamin B12 transporter